jgi:hypothetical protein
VREEVGYHFWLRYAAREGALIDDAGDSALMVLPPPLQARFDLPEQITVTTDPDIAREEGSLLLIPGHPVLDAAASHVLRQGDAGVAWLAWPAKPPPATSTLVAAARDQVGVEHGRIDGDAEALPRYAPVLRVSTQVTYVVNERFHEREEVSVDASTSLPLDAELERQIQDLPRLQGKPDHASLTADLLLALRTADRLLGERAAARLRSLAMQSQAALRDEVAVAESYYKGVLDGIAERKCDAPRERQALLDAQAQATRAERARRLHEIEEKFLARYDIHPIRLHLVLVPTLQQPVVIRRGERGYRLTLTWWLPTARYAAIRCPSCRHPAPLVAGREQLGCQHCLTPPSTQAPMASGTEAAAARRTVTVVSGSVPLRGESHPAAVPPKHPGPQVSRATAASRAETDELARLLQERAELRKRVIRIGNKLGSDFWQAVVEQDSWPRKRADPHSPLRVLYRLYGAEGPLRGVGIPVGAVPSQSTFFTEEPDAGFLQSTTGRVLAAGHAYPYTLRWHLASGKPAVDEVLPFRAAYRGLFPRWGLIADALFEDAPAPRIALDPVSASIWRVELAESGLPVVVRCLAAWWRIAEHPEFAAAPADLVAAALAGVICRRAGLDRTQKHAAHDYAVEGALVTGVARRLLRLLGLSESRNW